MKRNGVFFVAFLLVCHQINISGHEARIIDEIEPRDHTEDLELLKESIEQKKELQDSKGGSLHVTISESEEDDPSSHTFFQHQRSLGNWKNPIFEMEQWFERPLDSINMERNFQRMDPLLRLSRHSIDFISDPLFDAFMKPHRHDYSERKDIFKSLLSSKEDDYPIKSRQYPFLDIQDKVDGNVDEDNDGLDKARKHIDVIIKDIESIVGQIKDQDGLKRKFKKRKPDINNFKTELLHKLNRSTETQSKGNCTLEASTTKIESGGIYSEIDHKPNNKNFEETKKGIQDGFKYEEPVNHGLTEGFVKKPKNMELYSIATITDFNHHKQNLPLGTDDTINLRISGSPEAIQDINKLEDLNEEHLEETRSIYHDYQRARKPKIKRDLGEKNITIDKHDPKSKKVNEMTFKEEQDYELASARNKNPIGSMHETEAKENDATDRNIEPKYHQSMERQHLAQEKGISIEKEEKNHAQNETVILPKEKTELEEPYTSSKIPDMDKNNNKGHHLLSEHKTPDKDSKDPTISIKAIEEALNESNIDIEEHDHNSKFNINNLKQHLDEVIRELKESDHSEESKPISNQPLEKENSENKHEHDVDTRKPALKESRVREHNIKLTKADEGAHKQNSKPELRNRQFLRDKVRNNNQGPQDEEDEKLSKPEAGKNLERKRKEKANKIHHEEESTSQQTLPEQKSKDVSDVNSPKIRSLAMEKHQVHPLWIIFMACGLSKI